MLTRFLLNMKKQLYWNKKISTAEYIQGGNRMQYLRTAYEESDHLCSYLCSIVSCLTSGKCTPSYKALVCSRVKKLTIPACMVVRKQTQPAYGERFIHVMCRWH